MSSDIPSLSFPAILQNRALSSRLAKIRADADDENRVSNMGTVAPNPRDQYEGKRWLRRKSNAQFVGNPHIVVATKRDYAIQLPNVRPTFPEPLPPYLPRTVKLPDAQEPHTDPLSANAGRFSLSLKGMRKTLRRSGNRAEMLVRQIESELTEWLWEGGTLLNPDLPIGEADIQDLVLSAKPIQDLNTVLEVRRTPLQLVWYVADDAFTRYIIHCVARYHEVVSFSKEISGFRLTYLLRPNVTRPDRRAPTTLDTPPITDVDHSSQFESDVDFLSDLSEIGTDSDVALSERCAKIDLNAVPRAETEVFSAGDHSDDRSVKDSVHGDLSDIDNATSGTSYVALRISSLTIGATRLNVSDPASQAGTGELDPAHPTAWYTQPTPARHRVWNRSTSSPSRSPARTKVRRCAPLVRRYEPPKSTAAALGATRSQSFYDFLYS